MPQQSSGLGRRPQERVAEPVAVRYGFRSFLPGNLTNVRGLPVFPFRTDDFPPEK